MTTNDFIGVVFFDEALVVFFFLVAAMTSPCLSVNPIIAESGIRCKRLQAVFRFWYTWG